MTRLIDADDIQFITVPIAPLTKYDHVHYEKVVFKRGIENAPTIDALPVRHAKWIPCAKSGLILTEQMRKEGIRWYGFKCSACNSVRKGNAPRDASYCECCGARMDEE